MNTYMTLKMAFKAIFNNKLRSFLTMLGIIIGVSAVIIMTTLVQGATSNVTSSIESMGSNLLTVMIKGNYYNNSNILLYDDIKAFEEYASIKNASPVVSGNVTSKYGTTDYDTSLEGVDSSYLETKNYAIASGRFISALDNDNRNKVAVIGTTVKSELFGSQNPLGETIMINGTKFTVVGILEEKGSSMREDDDDKIVIPVKTSQRFLKQATITTIYFEALDEANVDIAEAQITQSLLINFDNDSDAFRIFDQTSLLDTINEVTGTMSLMLGGIAAISLVVGGIGIMNIMLVSVTERTREIGVRKAIGAKRATILIQFLIESSVVSGLGGIIGVILGVLIAYIAGNMLSMPASTPLYIIVISFSFSLIIGVFFGIYPANRAAKMKPVDALRYE